MKTQDVGNNNYFSSKKIISSSILGGLAAASVERAFLPNEVKAAIKNTRFGEDAFLKKTAECAEKTIKNLGTSKINPQQVIENAKNIYPDFVKTAKSANKQFAKTFIGIAGTIMAAKLISSAILKSRMSKEE